MQDSAVIAGRESYCGCEVVRCVGSIGASVLPSSYRS